MKRKKTSTRWKRLMALTLVLSLLLTGCGGVPEGEPEDTPVDVPSGAPAEDQDGFISEAEDIVDSEVSGADKTDETPPETLSEEDQALLARMGLTEDESIEISKEDAQAINRAVAEMRAAYVAGPGGADPLVEKRDWSVYTSSIARENLSNREAAYYDRLDKTCLEYLSTSALDGDRYRFDSGNVYYATEGIRFDDLGLSKSQARLVAYWFKFNHPQYYFLTNVSLESSNALFLCLYETMSDGEERAKITNELFDKLEGWIQDMENNASTNYEKEFYTNKLLSEENIYERQQLGSAWVDQSIYSSVMLGKTVCSGYALAFCAMMNAMNVDTVVALSVTHAWNVVRFDDGNYYAVDVCWNDTDSTPAYKIEYLNAGEEIMSATNSRKESHTYRDDLAAWIPAISKDKYQASEEDTQNSGAPKNICAQEVGPTAITLTWNEVIGAHQYEVAVFQDANRTDTKFTYKTSDPSFTFEQLNPGTNYEFGVCTIFKKNKKPKSTSDWVYFSAKTEEGEPEKLSVLTDVETVFQGADQAKTTWDGISWSDYFTKVEVCQYTDSSCTAMEEGYPKVTPSIYSHTWTGLEPGKTYYFGFRAYRRGSREVEKIYSDWVNVSYTHTGDS